MITSPYDTTECVRIYQLMIGKLPWDLNDINIILKCLNVLIYSNDE